jgi:hypothetical protein
MRTLPQTNDVVESQFGSRSCFVDKRQHRTLTRSTGHVLQRGHYIGDDPFHVHVDLELPGIGSIHNLFCSRKEDGDLFQDGRNVYSWRPTLSRGYSSTYSYMSWNSATHAVTNEYDSDSRQLPDVVVPDFSTFVLDLNDKGTNFIRQCRPGNPVASLGQFVGELHDLPKIPLLKSYANIFVQMGHEYLNYEFGWKPFVNDLKKAYMLSLDIDKRISALVRNNGIYQTRKRTRGDPPVYEPLGTQSGTQLFGSTILDGWAPLASAGISNLVVTGPFGTRGLHPLFSGSLQPTAAFDLKLERFEERVDWYKGTFKYYVPDIGSLQWTNRARAALYDVNVTPSVLYELYPWSWLVDWFSNVGDIISNLTTNAVDNEALVNSHIMSRQRVEHRITMNIQWDDWSGDMIDPIFGAVPAVERFVPAGSDQLIYSHLSLDKLRQPASPFGFGLTSSSFTARQIAILAALGLTHQRFF